MRFRDGLVVARGQVLWILLLVLSSVVILRAELVPDAPPAGATAAPD